MFESVPSNLEISHTTFVRKLARGKVLIINAMPKSASATTIECSVFATNPLSSVADLGGIKEVVSRQTSQLVSRQQRIVLNKEPLSSIAFHVPKQGEINKLLREHLDLEKELGAVIHPAARDQSFSQEGKADDDCKAAIRRDI